MMRKIDSIERKSCFLSLSTVLLGTIALCSDYWLVWPDWHAGFIKTCGGPLGICLHYSKVLSTLDMWAKAFPYREPRVRETIAAFASVTKNWHVYYVFGVIFAIYLPLITFSIATVLKGISLRLGPSKLRDAIATICTWIATYHGFGIMICTIVLGDIKNNATINGGQLGLVVSFGWSAYIGLFALIVGLAAAVTSLPLCNTRDCKDTQDDEPVQSDDLGYVALNVTDAPQCDAED